VAGECGHPTVRSANILPQPGSARCASLPRPTRRSATPRSRPVTCPLGSCRFPPSVPRPGRGERAVPTAAPTVRPGAAPTPARNDSLRLALCDFKATFARHPPCTRPFSVRGRHSAMSLRQRLGAAYLRPWSSVTFIAGGPRPGLPRRGFRLVLIDHLVPWPYDDLVACSVLLPLVSRGPSRALRSSCSSARTSISGLPGLVRSDRGSCRPLVRLSLIGPAVMSWAAPAGATCPQFPALRCASGCTWPVVSRRYPFSG